MYWKIQLPYSMNYRHWDHYVETIAHPFVAEVTNDGISNAKDIMVGQPYESPVAPFGGIEQIAWSMDSKSIAYTSRKKEGVEYAISTDADIYLYNLATGKTVNLCKPEGYKEPTIDATKSMRDQEVNHQQGDMHVGYDVNPKFSADGKYIAWQSMARNGYESDRNRLCVMEIATGKKKYVTESFDSNVDDYCWSKDSKSIYFMGVWHATEMLYQTNLEGKIMQITDGWYDYGSVQLANNSNYLLASRHSHQYGDELYIVKPGKEKKAKVEQVTFENKHIYDQLALGKTQQRWVKTTDGKEMLVWLVLPPHFDINKKYPTLLFCEGGPQSPVSQFWSYRWNLQIMAANGYIVVAPNRRGLPGFGSEWNEEVSGDWTGQCMNDYLSAIDDAAELPFVDKDRLGCVGASFGGFSVYYLASHHNKRFKAFIAHEYNSRWMDYINPSLWHYYSYTAIRIYK
jgi:Dipeptidyl aminopeptidases/acylaminoacyl-peptidases